MDATAETDAAPRSPKRALDDVDELVESESKRSKTMSPQEGQRVAQAAGENVETGGEAAQTAAATASKGSTEAASAPMRAAEPAATTTTTEAASAPALPPPPPPPQTESDEAPDAPPSPPKTKMCDICHEKEGKYKCARCALPFCSVACNKIHRENHPPDPEPAPKPPSPKHPAATAKSTDPSRNPHDPRNPFGVLDDSEQVRYLFRRYPLLRARLLEILAATEPPAGAQGAASAGGGSLNDVMKARALAAAHPKKEQWTHDVGIRRGKEALRKAKRMPGEEGEGVREYVELINHLVSKAGEAAEAAEIIRKQAAEQDTELIRRLMAEGR
ncbi:putative zinc-finger protein [Colletotrichum orbiculare MAFF 240422]|uniref:Zinc-finger protein n=1 Tax=Colletotrichum orbiculare (strain 104-T / ATCC 96160 / CBS 514.97 / LARS 414 / MAFF 240422) TaxID=1213857 RepID=A0A484FZ31_COLOR|nr:putative zinc-finger protein [Colletotrichum orbiculare MAFF 240422]